MPKRRATTCCPNHQHRRAPELSFRAALLGEPLDDERRRRSTEGACYSNSHTIVIRAEALGLPMTNGLWRNTRLWGRHRGQS